MTDQNKRLNELAAKFQELKQARAAADQFALDENDELKERAAELIVGFMEFQRAEAAAKRFAGQFALDENGTLFIAMSAWDRDSDTPCIEWKRWAPLAGIVDSGEFDCAAEPAGVSRPEWAIDFFTADVDTLEPMDA